MGRDRCNAGAAAGTGAWPAGPGQLLLALLLALTLCLLLPHAAVANAATSGTDVGADIYLHGRLASGEPLVASRAGGLHISGQAAACVNCHRRSGFGGTEGLIVIPPITARYLFFDARNPSAEDLDLPYVGGMRSDRVPYTEQTLERAIREGLGVNGKPLNYLMPHYALSPAEMSALIGYLHRMDRRTARGVTHNVLHFATIITPDADPKKSAGMLDVLQRFFDDKNLAPVGPTPRMRSSRKFRFMVNPHWQLHVWQLKGAPSTWRKQLDDYLAREPVLAVVSGMAGTEWRPVHRFCEERALPCLFPNVEAPPPDADRDFYSLYFSRGVYLEADLMADRLLMPVHGAPVRTVRQVYRAGDTGALAATALATELRRHGVKVKNIVLPRDLPQGRVARAIRRAFANTDTAVLWLRPDDLAALGKVPDKLPSVYASGLLGGLERAPLPAAWRQHVQLTYPFDLPDKRRINVDFAFGWFRIRKVPVVAPQVQADTYLACQVLAGAVRRMVDTFVPEYLVERIEDMIDTRIITGYYPHLTLAQAQRFASKGGYVVHFDGAQGSKVSADEGWTVPLSETGLDKGSEDGGHARATALAAGQTR